jgi:fucose permease
MFSFFVISFITNILGPIIPEATKDLHLTLAEAGILPFAFFIAYSISIPAGYILEKYGSKFVIILAFTIGIIGSLIFSFHPNYCSYLISLFIIGVCVAILQVAFWPLLRTAGGEENYSFYSVLTQIFFGVASFISPLVYSYLVLNIPYNGNRNLFLIVMSKIVPNSLSWVAIYWLNALIMVIMIVITGFIKFPKIELRDSEKVEGFIVIKKLLKNKIVIIYFFAIFSYVGMEQGISVWISKFLQDYHGYNANTVGAHVVALFWAMQCIGSLLGIILLKLFDVKRILSVFLILQIIALSVALFGRASLSLLFFPICGFLSSVMYGSIFSLGMNSIRTYHGTVAGIFCTGIIGGAVIPLFVGAVGNITNLRFGMCLVYATILFMLYISLTAQPLVNNKTIKLREFLKANR